MAPIRAATAVSTACMALVVLAACARDCSPFVDGGWVRWLPVEAPASAGFARIENPCSAPLTIVGASSPAFADVSLHETRVDAGMSRMRAVDRLRIPANGAVQLRPGGLHLMMVGSQVPLTPGSTVPIQFALEGGGTLAGEMIVQAAPP